MTSKNKIKLIGLTGYAGTGKDTVRKILEEHGFIGLAFADPIREMLRTLMQGAGICSGYMDDRALKEEIIPHLGVSYRHMAQTLGTEWGRSLQPDLWLRLAGRNMDSYIGAGELLSDIPVRFVVSDVRFEDEADWIRERGGVIWQINRPGATPVRAHASEEGIAQIKPDMVINNTGNMFHLRMAVAQQIN